MTYLGLRQALREDPEGVKAVLSVAGRIPKAEGRSSIDVAKELARAIETESGWIPGAVNPRSGASGLIQFMPATAKGLGTTVEEIRTMSRGDQARLIETYLTRVAKHYGGLKREGDVYVALAYPAALAWDTDRIIAEPGSAIWKQNEIWRDPAYDGAVTVRRLLEIGKVLDFPADLRIEVAAIMAEQLGQSIEELEKRVEPAPSAAPSAAPSSPAPSAAPSTPAPTPEPPDKGKPEATVAIPSAPVSTPPPSGRSSKGNGGATLGAALLGLGLLAWLLRRGCL